MGGAWLYGRYTTLAVLLIAWCFCCPHVTAASSDSDSSDNPSSETSSDDTSSGGSSGGNRGGTSGGTSGGSSAQQMMCYNCTLHTCANSKNGPKIKCLGACWNHTIRRHGLQLSLSLSFSFCVSLSLCLCLSVCKGKKADI